VPKGEKKKGMDGIKTVNVFRKKDETNQWKIEWIQNYHTKKTSRTTLWQPTIAIIDMMIYLGTLWSSFMSSA
jgi:hypothetical protein